MDNANLIHFITAYGTRTKCDLSELIHQVGQHDKGHLYHQLDQLERAGIIYTYNGVVSIKNPSIAEGV